MCKFIKDFKEFAMKGNVLDMAIGVIIGAAFGKIITSLVADIIMPLVGLAIGGIDFKGLKFAIGGATVTYGLFIQNVIDFLIIAFCIFLFVRIIVKISSRNKKEPEAPEAAPEPTNEEKILTEIRDLLKENK
jgi:large conductance mechanosensitive channel